MGASWRIRIVAGVVAVVATAAMYLVATSGEPDSAGEVASDESDTEARSGSDTPGGAGSLPPPVTTTPVPLGETDLRGLSFTDVTAEAGLAVPHSLAPPTSGEVMNGAAAAGDYDSDGDIDLVLTRMGLPNLLYRNDGSGHFTDVAEQAGVAGPVPPAGGGTPLLADLDGDGTLDLLLSGNPSGGRALYLNDGDGTFSDATAGSGLEFIPDERGYPQAFGAASADWDGDGDLDLAVLQWYVEPMEGPAANEAAIGSRGLCERADVLESADLPMPDVANLGAMYANDGDGTFTDVTNASGVTLDDIAAFTPLFSDIDGDGSQDLLITGDVCTSRIYHNDGGGRFDDVTDSAGVGTDENGMGSVVADIDGDGNLDWFITSIAYPVGDDRCPFDGLTVGCTGNRLYLGDGEGSFTDATDDFGMRDGYWGWAAAAEDLNNDGFRDVVMTNGYAVPSGEGGIDPAHARFVEDPSLLWLGRAEAPFPEVAPQVGIEDRGLGKGLVTFDSDSDGDLDVLMVNTGSEPVLFRNDTPPGGNWAILRLHQPGPNTAAVGARVAVHTTGREAPIPLEVRAGGSFLGSSPYDLHVGLGEESIDRIEVLWPGATEAQVIDSPAPRSVVEIERGAI